MEIPAPSLLHYQVPRGSTYFLANVSFHPESADQKGRVHIFFAPPAERYFDAPEPTPERE